MSGAIHLTTATRIVCKHRNMRHMSVDGVLRNVTACAAATEPDPVEARIIDHLQRATGMTIQQLADLAKSRWPK